MDVTGRYCHVEAYWEEPRRSAALNVTANDETSAVGELKFNIGQDGTPVCGGIQQSICEYFEEPSPTPHQHVQHTLYERANYIFITQSLL